jgi:hypothetical protein
MVAFSRLECDVLFIQIAYNSVPVISFIFIGIGRGSLVMLELLASANG